MEKLATFIVSYFDNNNKLLNTHIVMAKTIQEANIIAAELKPKFSADTWTIRAQ